MKDMPRFSSRWRLLALLYFILCLGGLGCQNAPSSAYDPAVAKLLQLAAQDQSQGQLPAAIEKLHAASALSDKRYEPDYNLGILYLEQSQAAPAITALENALKKAPQNPDVLYSLAYAYETYASTLLQGDSDTKDEPKTDAKAAAMRQKALETYQTYLKTAPDTHPNRKQAQEAILQLEQSQS